MGNLNTALADLFTSVMLIALVLWLSTDQYAGVSDSESPKRLNMFIEERVFGHLNKVLISAGDRELAEIGVDEAKLSYLSSPSSESTALGLGCQNISLSSWPQMEVDWSEFLGGAVLTICIIEDKKPDRTRKYLGRVALMASDASGLITFEWVIDDCSLELPHEHFVFTKVDGEIDGSLLAVGRQVTTSAGVSRQQIGKLRKEYQAKYKHMFPSGVAYQAFNRTGDSKYAATVEPSSGALVVHAADGTEPLLPGYLEETD